MRVSAHSCLINRFTIPSKLSISKINNKVIEKLKKNNLLNGNHYGFSSAWSTADVLTVIIPEISKALDSKFITKTIALDISKVGRYRRFLHKLSSYEIPGRIFLIMKPFISGTSMKVVYTSQSSEAHEINVGVP